MFVCPSVYMSVCILLLGEQEDGFAQFFLEVVGEVQEGVNCQLVNTKQLFRRV